MNTKFSVAVVPLLAAVVIQFGQVTAVSGQDAAPATPKAGAQQPMVLHVHHHHYYDASKPSTDFAFAYSPGMAWHYVYQVGMGISVQPWKQDFGHGYLGQHGDHVGLVVDRLVPDGPASNLGLVRGDFIEKINGQQVDIYMQVAVLLEQIELGSEKELILEVWNPNTGRTTAMRARLKQD